MKFKKLLYQNEQMYIQEKLILDESLFKEYYDNNKIEYKPVSDIGKFKKYADEILGGYGGMSDSDIKKDIEEIYIDDELKGYIGLSKYNEEDGTKLLGIGNFMIIERGKGYGTQVINDIVSKYKNEYDLIYCFVDSDNEGAISLYKKLGKVYDEDGPNDNGQYYVTFYDNGKYKLEESWQTGFKYGYAGYILRNGDIITLDDVPYNDRGDMRLAQHGEGDQDLPKEDKTLEISNSHNEDDTCVRLYDIPTNEQYKSLEFVIDKYLDEEGYCKVEFLNPLKHKYVIFANDTLEYSSFPYSAEEVNFADKIYEGSNWNGYTIVRWIKQNINKKNLTEAKKKKKKKSQTQNTPVFKDINDLLRWAKKRQKGLPCFGGWLNPNAGNVEYSNSMFNQMMGSADGASSVGVSDGGISNGGLSAPAGDAGGGGMGESFTQTSADNKVKENINNEKFKITSKLNYFIHYNQDLINAEEWDTLFEVAEDELSIDEQACLVEMLLNIGCEFKILD